MTIKAVVGMLLMQLKHPSIACDLCEDRRGGDRVGARIAFDQRLLWAVVVQQALLAVDNHKDLFGADPQRLAHLPRAVLHSPEGRTEDIEAIDLFYRDMVHRCCDRAFKNDQRKLFPPSG